MIRFKRMSAIFLGFAVQIIMMMLIAICAFERKSPTPLLYIGLLIAGCVWLEIIIVDQGVAVGPHFHDVVRLYRDRVHAGFQHGQFDLLQCMVYFLLLAVCRHHDLLWGGDRDRQARLQEWHAKGDGMRSLVGS
jgi:hypothetical protein